MGLNITWTMRVAVISKQHHPVGWRPGADELSFASDLGDHVIYLEDLVEPPSWLAILATALVAEGYGWVRFDQDAEVIPGLPVFLGVTQ